MKYLSVFAAAMLLTVLSCNHERKVTTPVIVKDEAATLDTPSPPSQKKLEEEKVTVQAYSSAKASPARQLQEKSAGLLTRVMKREAGNFNQMVHDREFNTEGYDNITDNTFHTALHHPLSTFSIDVDAASYTNIRRFIHSGSLPPAGAVRIEEMINYFHYGYEEPKNGDPFAVNTEFSICPWNPLHGLLKIGLKAKQISSSSLPPANLVFLIDVSGSMDQENKLPLVKSSLKLLTEQLREQDRIAIVVYAGAAGLVLPSTPGSEKQQIMQALNKLEAGGSTAGGEGIRLAYKIARENFSKEGNNRIILSTDGDFNVGASSDDDMVRLIEKERGSGIFLSVLGFGMGNYKDNKMQLLADKGNGNHFYIDNLSEARRIFVNEFGGTLFTIAKDVKLQVEFNPATVQAYRLIGYENRMLASEDFRDDKKDAGEIGSGHTVTALYEIIPTGIKNEFERPEDSLHYQPNPVSNLKGPKDELMTIKIRYKKPSEETSQLFVTTVKNKPLPLKNSSDDFRFAASVAEFGMLLRNSPYKQKSSFEQVISMAAEAKGKDTGGYRADFIQLATTTGSMVHNQDFNREKNRSSMVKE